MVEPSNRDKLLCVERELGFRRRVYPRLCATGKMTAADSEREIAIMQAIAADYAVLVERDEPKLL